MKHNDAEIEVLFRTNESDLVERKRSTNLKEEILEAICAFANDLPDHQRAGVIFIGVNDDGTCANQTFSEKTLREVVNWPQRGQNSANSVHCRRQSDDRQMSRYSYSGDAFGHSARSI